MYFLLENFLKNHVVLKKGKKGDVRFNRNRSKQDKARTYHDFYTQIGKLKTFTVFCSRTTGIYNLRHTYYIKGIQRSMSVSLNIVNSTARKTAIKNIMLRLLEVFIIEESLISKLQLDLEAYVNKRLLELQPKQK